MEFKNKIRVSLVTAGLGAALLFCSCTKAQEITNTRFSDGPNVAAFESGTAQAAANSSVSPAASSSQTGGAMDAAALANAAAEQDSYERRTSMLIWGGATLIWIGAIGLYAGGPAKRFTEQLRAKRKQYAESPNA
jgi:hypothetical protein